MPLGLQARSMPIITSGTEVSTITLEYERKASIYVRSDKTVGLAIAGDLFGLTTTQARHFADALKEAANMADAIYEPWSEVVTTDRR